MNKQKLKIVLGLVVIAFLSYMLGDFLAIKNGRKIDDKKVVFRVEYREDDVDFSLKSMFKQMQRKYEKDGFEVKYSYFGNLYPKELDNAGVNIFVRSYMINYDKRVFEEAYNIYLVPYIYTLYKEEFRNFDAYMSPQKMFTEASIDNGIDMTYIKKEEFDNKKLNRRHAKDVVYVYEKRRDDILNYMQNVVNAKIYSSTELAKLSDGELEDVLSMAKVVVFDSNRDIVYDDDYVPFGVYNILGYGVDVILDKGNVSPEIKGLSYFASKEELMHKLGIF